jgi:hypothetical protein
MVLDDDDSDKADAEDEAGDASSDIDASRVERDTSPHNILATLELASGSAKPIDASGPWYDVEEGCYIDEPAPRPGSFEQYGVPSAPAQDQPQILPPSSTPLQD